MFLFSQNFLKSLRNELILGIAKNIYTHKFEKLTPNSVSKWLIPSVAAFNFSSSDWKRDAKEEIKNLKEIWEDH